MKKVKDDGLTSRALMALVTAMADKNYRDAEVIVAPLDQRKSMGLRFRSKLETRRIASRICSDGGDLS
jgi:hypothetical protein